MRLALVAGPVLQVLWVAVLICPVSGELAVSCDPELWPDESLHWTS